jgi:hypothetical protein
MVVLILFHRGYAHVRCVTLKQGLIPENINNLPEDRRNTLKNIASSPWAVFGQSGHTLALVAALRDRAQLIHKLIHRFCGKHVRRHDADKEPCPLQ